MLLERADIEKVFPHRDQALLLDKAEVNPDNESAVGYLMVIGAYCAGHFPDNPIFWGINRIEMIAQTLGLAARTEIPEGYLPYLGGGRKFRFPGKVVPGNLLRAEAKVTRKLLGMIQGDGKAYVDDRLVAEVKGLVFIIGKDSDI
ncbi:MAG: hypothetical protein V1808_03575 [Candidatus Daviesbacteria bacterium]